MEGDRDVGSLPQKLVFNGSTDSDRQRHFIINTDHQN